MSKDPSFPFYAQDFLSGVMHMNYEQRGIYITLLAYQWNNKDLIPKKRLGFLVGYDWVSLPEEVKEKFIEIGDCIQNARLLEVRNERNAFKERQSKNGKKGGRPPKNSKKTVNKKTQKKLFFEDEDESEKENYNFLKVKKTKEELTELVRTNQQFCMVKKKNVPLDDTTFDQMLEDWSGQNNLLPFDDTRHIFNSFGKYLELNKPKSERLNRIQNDMNNANFDELAAG